MDLLGLFPGLGLDGEEELREAPIKDVSNQREPTTMLSSEDQPSAHRLTPPHSAGLKVSRKERELDFIKDMLLLAPNRPHNACLVLVCITRA